MIRDQMYIEAITALNYQLQMFPRSRAAISLLAYCYYHIQDYVQAVTQYEQLTKFCPYVTEYKIYYAQALFKAGRYADAIKQSLRVDGEQHQHRMIKLRAQIKYEQEDLAGCKTLADQCLADDADAIVTRACIDFKEKKYKEAKKKFVEASNQLGYQPDLAYNIALCFYQLKAYSQSLKSIAEIIERGVREHPELSVGSNTDAGNVRSVGNSNVLRETALIEAFNLKAAIEYSLKNLEPAKMALNDMPPRAEEELDAVTLHNQALINIEANVDSGLRKLVFLLNNPPFPPPTFSNLLMLYVKYKFYDLAADVYASHQQFQTFLSQDVREFLEATIMVTSSPAEAYRKFDDLTTKHIETLRRFTKEIQDARIGRDNNAIREALKKYDEALDKFMPVLMSMAKIYWDRDNYMKAEQIFRTSAEFCSEHEVWKLNVAHVFFMQENRFREAIRYYEPFVRKHSENILEVPAIILANLCVSFIMISQNEDAEELMRTIEKEEDQLAYQDPDKKCYHLCIVNLVIGTLYCAKGNYEFGISRIIKSLEPYDKKLGTDTWFHAKRCFVALAEMVAKQMVVLKDSSYVEIISFLEAADMYGKEIQTRSHIDIELEETNDPLNKTEHTVSREARILKKIYLKLQE